MNKKISETAFLDVLRWTAAAMVIMLHVVSGISTLPDIQMTRRQLDIYYTIKALMTTGVPLFLMISGSLLLNPDKPISVRRIFDHYLRRVLLSLLLFGTVFAIMELVMTENSFSPYVIWKGFLNMVSGKSWAHMWYLYELAGLYLATPLLKAAITCGGVRLLRYGVLLGFLFSSLIPFIKQTAGFELGITYPFSGIYLLYYVSGYYLLRYVKGSPRLYLFLSAAAAAAITADTMFLKLFRISYDSPLIVLLAAGLFLSAANSRVRIPWMSHHRNLCFGIYLLHPVFLNLFYKLFHITPLDFGYAGILLFWAATLLLSCLGSQIMQQVPPLRKYVV